MIPFQNGELHYQWIEEILHLSAHNTMAEFPGKREGAGLCVNCIKRFDLRLNPHSTSKDSPDIVNEYARTPSNLKKGRIISYRSAHDLKGFRSANGSLRDSKYSPGTVRNDP